MEPKYIHLIHKRLTGTLLPDEAAILQAWEDESPEHKLMVGSTVKSWEMSAAYEPAFQPDVEAGLRKLKSRIVQDQPTEAKRIQLQSKTSRRIWLRVAAAIAILLVAIGWLFYTPSPTALAFTKVQTKAGEQKNLQLADGSRIELNGNSQLSYPETFGARDRIVHLEGEAFFDIARDESHPFRIQLAAGEVSVLGTSFNVRTYPDEQVVEVTVRSGKVRFTFPNSSQYEDLTAGEHFIYKIDKKRFEKTQDTDLNSIAWYTNQLNFRDTKLQHVATQVSRCYNIQLSIQNPNMLNCAFTSFFKNTAPEEVMATIAKAFQMEVMNNQDNKYTLSGGSCK